MAFDLRAVSLAEGARAGLAVAVVVALHQWLQWPGLMESALAALLTCLSDVGGPVQRRLPALLAFGLIGAGLTTLFTAVHDAPAWLVVPLAATAVFATAFARALGPAAMQVGNLLSVVVVLALRADAPPPADAAAIGLTFAGGSLWAVLLTLLIWRTYPYRPARAAVATCLRRMSRMAADMRETAAAPDEAGWDQHARAHRRAVREALDVARTAVLAVVQARGPAAGPAAQSWLRLEAAEQLFEALIAFSDLLAGGVSDAERLRADRTLRLVVAVLDVLQREIVAEHIQLRPGLERAIAAITIIADPNESPRAAALRQLAGIMAERLRAALSPSQGSDPMLVAARPNWRDPLRANLRLGSDVMRHALRSGLVAGIGFAIVRYWPTPYLHWFTITAVMTLQPYLAVTVVRAVERIAGTVLGGFLAAALGLVCTTPLSTAAALFPLSVLALTVRGVSFGLFMTTLTPVVVLLSEIGRPGTSEMTIALSRALLTAAGGLVALLSCLVLWPAWEPRRVLDQMREALLAHGRFADAVIGEILGETDGAVDAARRGAGAASNALEASLQRVLLERGLSRTAPARLEAMLTVDAALRRLAGRLAVLHLTPIDSRHDLAGWRAMRSWMLAVTEQLGTGQTEVPPRPAMPQAGAEDAPFARLARPLELAAGALARATAPG